jgi:hypothetical protein
MPLILKNKSDRLAAQLACVLHRLSAKASSIVVGNVGSSASYCEHVWQRCQGSNFGRGGCRVRTERVPISVSEKVSAEHGVFAALRNTRMISCRLEPRPRGRKNLYLELQQRPRHRRGLSPDPQAIASVRDAKTASCRPLWRAGRIVQGTWPRTQKALKRQRYQWTWRPRRALEHPGAPRRPLGWGNASASGLVAPDAWLLSPHVRIGAWPERAIASRF